MTEDKILTKEEVLRDGVCFEDELDWGGEFYEQIVCENDICAYYRIKNFHCLCYFIILISYQNLS